MVRREIGTLALSALALGVCPPLQAQDAEPAAAAVRAGRLLLATAQLQDANFARSVVFVVEHNARGTLGLIVNRAHRRGPLAALLRGFAVAPGAATGEVTLFAGGPVGRRRVFVLHDGDYAAEATHRVTAGVAFTPGLAPLRALSAGEGPENYRIVFGYAGWGPGQLAQEIARGDWLVRDAPAAAVFGDPEGLWQRLHDGEGVPL